MSNITKNFDLATNLFYIIILIVQQNYFSDLYPAKSSFNKIILSMI